MIRTYCVHTVFRARDVHCSSELLLCTVRYYCHMRIGAVLVSELLLCTVWMSVLARYSAAVFRSCCLARCMSALSYELLFSVVTFSAYTFVSLLRGSDLCFEQCVYKIATGILYAFVLVCYVLSRIPYALVFVCLCFLRFSLVYRGFVGNVVFMWMWFLGFSLVYMGFLWLVGF